MKAKQNKNWYVANYLGTLAGHDLDIDAAREVLRKQLEEDPENRQEWEIFNSESEA